jgi:cysteinyl-tRNA synthetase
MSKSKGNFFTVRDILDKGASPAALRLELIRTHYRQNANFTMQGLRDCQRQVDRWCRLARRLESAEPCPDAEPGPLQQALAGFSAALADDLNVQGAIGILSEAVGLHPTEGVPSGDPIRELEALRRMDGVLAVLDRNQVEESGDEELSARVETLISARNQARADRDWAEADRIRDEIADLGLAIKDGPEGTTWSKVVE